MVKAKKNTPVPFGKLGQYNDSNSFVWVGLVFNPKEQQEIEDFLKKEIRFLPRGGKILSMHLISGNVRGKRGRSDVLFVTSETYFNAIARLGVDGLTWTSDFIANYGKDYGWVPARVEE